MKPLSELSDVLSISSPGPYRTFTTSYTYRIFALVSVFFYGSHRLLTTRQLLGTCDSRLTIRDSVVSLTGAVRSATRGATGLLMAVLGGILHRSLTASDSSVTGGERPILLTLLVSRMWANAHCLHDETTDGALNAESSSWCPLWTTCRRGSWKMVGLISVSCIIL